MQDQDKAWREIQLLIERDKAAALKEFHRRPFQPAIPVPARSQALFRLRPALTAVAASLLLAVGLLSLWLLRGSWKSAPATPAWNEILADSFLYAASGTGEPVSSGTRATGPVSSRFTTWAATARELAARNDETSVATSTAAATVERGDPDEVKRRLGRAIQEDAFERLLSHWQEFHEKEV